KRFSIVETPIQFTQYSRSWSVAFESTQPEISLLPENGISLNEADFRLNKRRQERFGDRRNQVTLPRENQSNLLKRFITANLLDGPNSTGYISRRDIRQKFINPYSAFPNYYSFVSYVNSNELPIINSVLELYLKVEPKNTEPFVRDVLGLTNMERAIQKFKGISLKNIIADTTNNKFIKDFLKIRGIYLFTAIGSKIGESNFKDLIKRISEENRFSSISFDLLDNRLLADYGLDIMPFIDQWFYSEQLPGYYISALETKKIIDNQRERYQTEFNLTNPEEVEGYLKIIFKSRGEPEGRRGRRFRPSQEDDEGIDERTIHIGAKQTKRIGVLLDEEPGNLSINTILSQNLPLQIEIPLEEFKESKREIPFDGEEILIDGYSIYNENELIVDNEETGFEVFNPGTKSWLKKTLNLTNEDEEKYIGIRYWWAPENWRATIHSEAFGKYVRSAHYTRAGDGDIKVAWNAEIREGGYYDVYSHVLKFESRWRDEDRGQDQYHYSIIHDDGRDDVNLDVGNAEKGWNLLGSFYFSEGKATVELTNESSDQLVIADAIKWVKTD
ncbi:MAG: hypothetical protein R3250_12555, partial [Melioribacteraceae bacterium]|nr:hypothetical protein [Melioribacteraceae bacterium]